MGMGMEAISAGWMAMGMNYRPRAALYSTPNNMLSWTEAVETSAGQTSTAKHHF